jgi:3-(3-hydroxy-phenyl)propionate hydroxylase
LLLAGDSAHQMPPFLGQGMCSGLRDAGNLAWKLRDVIAGNALDSLLDTYESERTEHVRAYIELAVELGSVIQTTDPEKARQRDRDLIANPTMLRPLAPRLGPGLHGDASPPAATRAAQPRLTDGKLLDDYVGYRFAVLATRHLVDALPAATQARIGGTNAVLVAAEGEGAAYLADLRAGAVVIRPDRYILGVASTPAELDAVLSRRRCHPAATSIAQRTPQTAAAI